MERRALLAWLLELIRRSPEPQLDAIRADALIGPLAGAIEVVFAGKRFVIRIEEGA